MHAIGLICLCCEARYPLGVQAVCPACVKTLEVPSIEDSALSQTLAVEYDWGALRRAVDCELTPRQRQVFVAIVLNEVPLATLVTHLGSSRNAIYQVMFEARRKLRAALVAGGYLGHDTAGRS